MAIVVGGRRRRRRVRAIVGMRGMGACGCKALRAPGDVAGMGDPLIWTPSAIESFKAQVSTEIDAISSDVTTAWANGQLSTAARAPWKAFYDEWIAYRDSIGFLGTLWGATADRLKDYQARAAQWRQQLIGQGVAVTAPPPAPPGGTDFTPYLKWGLVVVGGLVVVKLVSVFK